MKNKIKQIIVSSHKFVTIHAEDFESWEWENTVLDNLNVMVAKAWKTDWERFFFLRGFMDYLDGHAEWMHVIDVYNYSKYYRKGLQVASELCEEIKYFDEAFGKDSYELTI